jgi:outer membrane protein assembly factor BamB
MDTSGDSLDHDKGGTMTLGNGKTQNAVALIFLLATAVAAWPDGQAWATHRSFAPGDVFVALRTGEVQWRHADGTLNAVLVGAIPGKVEGMGFDAAGNLYVSHYCADLSVCLTGNSIEKFNAMGIPQGAFGSGYNCNPFSIVFDGAGRAYVGQADCTGDILEFSATGMLQRALHPEPEVAGSAWVDLAADGCTMLYTSRGRNVKSFNVCANMQLPDFNTGPLPGGAHQLRVLSGGGVLVATDEMIVRLDAAGAVVQTYDVPGEFRLWYGVALVGDGTFWASNYGTSNVYRFDLASGAVLTVFNAGTPTTTVKGLAVMK